MELSDAQKQAVTGWIAEGADVAEIQERLRNEFGINITYMDVRFLLVELEATPRDKPASAARQTVAAPPPAADSAAEGVDSGGGAGNLFDEAGGTGGGAVSVSFDKVIQPGAIVSGSATFSDGVSATWMLDQMGRLAINASQPGYRPSESDLQKLQVELSNGLQKMGY